MLRCARAIRLRLYRVLEEIGLGVGDDRTGRHATDLNKPYSTSTGRPRSPGASSFL
jgi:hypothetical protein